MIVSLKIKAVLTFGKFGRTLNDLTANFPSHPAPVDNVP